MTTPATDPAAYWTRRALETLFVYSPIATSVGVLVGVSAYGASQVFQPALQASRIINPAAITWWWCSATAIVLTNIVAIIYAVMTGIHRVPPSIAAVLRVIHRGRKQRSIKSADEQRLYVEACELLMKNIVLSDAAKRELSAVENAAAVANPDSVTIKNT
jgi:hypothetical protein